LRADKEEEDEAYRDCGADGDAPCDLPIRHGGSKSSRCRQAWEPSGAWDGE
jgi:hypothetical protein